MGLGDRLKRLDERVLGPAPPPRPSRWHDPRAWLWATVGVVGSLVAGTRWGLVALVVVGLVVTIAVGLVQTRRDIHRARPVAEGEFVEPYDPVLDWLSRRNLRTRRVLIFVARFPFFVAPVLGAAAGFGVTASGCVHQDENSRCVTRLPGHQTVIGGVVWGLLAAALIYAGAMLVRESMLRAAARSRRAASDQD